MKKTLTIFGTIEFGKSYIQGYKESPCYLGGNGILASLAAAKILPVQLVGVIGTDITRKNLEEIVPENVNIKHVEQYPGKTFHYKAVYHSKTFDIIDQDISFGVYSQYQPHISSKKIKESTYILLSGSNPKYGLEVLQQLNGKQIVGVCTLLYHLEHNFTYTKRLIEKATYLFTSKKEYAFLLQKKCNPFVLSKNLKAIFATEGKDGVTVYTQEKTFFLPVRQPVTPLDPTNAGDVFAGTIMGMIAKGYMLNKDLPLLITSAQQEAINVISNDAYYRKEILESRAPFLEEIVQTKKKEVASAKKVLSLQKLQILCQENKQNIRNFLQALQKGESISLIAEIKKASPSNGLIRTNFDCKKIAQEYQNSELVNAISVLTDKKYFQGDLCFISDVKESTSLPVLRKDFIIDTYQIYESYLARADAILLIVSILTQTKLKDFLAVADQLGLSCLVEVHTKNELRKAVKAGAKIIGINARDLKTFTIDKHLFEKLSSLVPKEIVLVAESGIERYQDIVHLRKAGAQVVLVGTSFMKEKNISAKIKEVMKGGERYASVI